MSPEKQMLESGTQEITARLRSLRQSVKMHESSTEADMAIIFDAFVNAVGKLEGILDKETMMLIEQRMIALEEFNHKKRHGLLELSRAMDAIGWLRSLRTRSNIDFGRVTSKATEESRNASNAFGCRGYDCRNYRARHSRA